MLNVSRPVQDEASLRQKRHAAFAAETTGLLVIAGVLFVVILLGFWRDLHWSLR